MSNLIIFTNLLLIVLFAYKANKNFINYWKFNLTRWLMDNPNTKAPLDFSIAHQLLMSKLKFWQLNGDPTVDKLVVHDFMREWNEMVREYVLGNANIAQPDQETKTYH